MNDAMELNGINEVEAAELTAEETIPAPIVVDSEDIVHLFHDTAHDMYVSHGTLAENGQEVTVLRCLASSGLNVSGHVAVFINDAPGFDLESVVSPGDEVYVAGKLQGGSK